jgi:hypothetical protein
VKEYASLNNDVLSHSLAKIEEDIINRKMGRIQIKSTYDRLVGSMYGFLMIMHELIPSSLTNAEREFQLKTNEIFKYEISILNGLKLKLEKIIPNDLLTISMNTVATPPHYSQKMISILLRNDFSFVDLKTFESPYYSQILTNITNRKPPNDYNWLWSSFISSFEIGHNKYEQERKLKPNTNADGDYYPVDIYGSEDGNTHLENVMIKHTQKF